jgi:hypothetical protein
MGLGYRSSAADARGSTQLPSRQMAHGRMIRYDDVGRGEGRGAADARGPPKPSELSGLASG